MSVKIYKELIQGTDEWLHARCGLLTASTIHNLITPTLKVASNDSSRALTTVLAAERITGHVEEVFVNHDMMRGTLEEPIARDAYATERKVQVAEVGFMVDSDTGLGYSPDGLVGHDGLIEIKSRRPKKHVLTILSQEVPKENMAQIQTGLFISGRDWCDYISFCGGMHLWIKRVEPDEKWFEAIVKAAETFEANVAQIIRNYEHLTEGLPLTERTQTFEDITF